MNKDSIIQGFVDSLSAVMEKELGTQSTKKEEHSVKKEKKFIEAPEDIKIQHLRVTFETDEESNISEEKEIYIDYPESTSSVWNTILSDEEIEKDILSKGVIKFLESLVKDLSPSTEYIVDMNLAIDIDTLIEGNLKVFCVNKPIISRK